MQNAIDIIFPFQTMAFANYFLVLILVFITTISTPILANNQHAPMHLEAFIIQACENIEDQGKCLANVHYNLRNNANKNPRSIIRAALRNSLDEARRAIDMITQFHTFSTNTREQIAIEDCRELLDFSVSELAWSLAEMRKIRASNYSHHDEGSLKAWLSAALSNQDTCLEGFEGTDRRLETFIKGSLTQVTQLINNVLTLYVQLHSVPFKPLRNNHTIIDENGLYKYPKWLANGDKELLVGSQNGMHVDVVVALDGSGHFRSINQAIYASPSYSNRRYVIYIKKGVYHENIDLKKKKTNIMFVGDGIGQTIITGNRNFMQGWTTFRTATVAVSGKGFIARDITFRNTAGPRNFQAVALRVDSDQSAFFRCSMEGYQDTLYAHSLRQFFRECNVYGTIDFIFGNGAAVLQNCKIFTREPLPLQKVTITAQGRKSPNQNTGFSIEDSYIHATRTTYLGRPWKQYSRTVIMNTYMSSFVEARGWLEWYGDFALNTLWYGEYKNYGPGSSLNGRVKWPGYHIIKDPLVASYFTVKRFIDGLSWLPSTGVKFSAGLRN